MPASTRAQTVPYTGKIHIDSTCCSLFRTSKDHIHLDPKVAPSAKSHQVWAPGDVLAAWATSTRAQRRHGCGSAYQAFQPSPGLMGFEGDFVQSYDLLFVVVFAGGFPCVLKSGGRLCFAL